jgi:hypothetical protein
MSTKQANDEVITLDIKVGAKVESQDRAGIDSDGPEFSDGHDHEGFAGGCARFGCPGGDNCISAKDARIAELETALRRVLDCVVRLNEAEPDKRIAYNQLMQFGNGALQGISQLPRHCDNASAAEAAG